MRSIESAMARGKGNMTNREPKAKRQRLQRKGDLDTADKLGSTVQPKRQRVRTAALQLTLQKSLCLLSDTQTSLRLHGERAVCNKLWLRRP